MVKITDESDFMYLGGQQDGKDWKWSGILYHFVPNGGDEDEKEN